MLRVKKGAKSALQWDKVADSANKTVFNSGSERDDQLMKGRYDLIPSNVVKRLAQHYENGARKYAARNWEKGQQLSQYYNSAMRHLLAIGDADVSEDHAAAVLWNVAAIIHHVDAIINGQLPRELDDIGFVHAVELEQDNQETLNTVKEVLKEHEWNVTYNPSSSTTWRPVVSGAMPDDDVSYAMRRIIHDTYGGYKEAGISKQHVTSALERTDGMTDAEWEHYKQQLNAGE